MPSGEPAITAATRDMALELRATIEDEAREAIAAGAATVSTASVAELYGTDSGYDSPVVTLTPANPAAAELRVEVQGPDLWWVAAGGGPGIELRGEPRDEHHRLLRQLVRAVVAGRHEQGWEGRSRRELLRPWRRRAAIVRTARFRTDGEPIEVEHWGDDSPTDEQPRQRFEPYERTRP